MENFALSDAHLVLLNMSSVRDWDNGVANRNGHIARHLCQPGRFSRVLLVDFLPFSFRGGIKTVLRSGLGIHRTQWGKHVFRMSTLASLCSPKALRSAIHHALVRLSMADRLVVWSYHPFFPDLLTSLSPHLSIFDAVDDWCEHPAYRDHRPRLLRAYQLIEETADVIFAVSDQLKKRMPNGRVITIPNGVDVLDFSRPPKLPTPLDHLPHPIIGYAGVIQERLDVQLLKKVIPLHRDKHFVFMGPVWPDARIETLKAMSNVHFVGPLPYRLLPSALAKCDATLLPHLSSPLTASMNPLKLYEYLAAGKPVIATKTAGTHSFSSVISLADTPETFSEAITIELREDNADRKKARQEAVQNASWENRVTEMLSHIVTFNRHNSTDASSEQ